MQNPAAFTALLQPMRYPRFRRLWLCNLLSSLGSWGHAFAVMWHVSALSKSTMTTALVQSANWVPVLLFALPAGWLADAMHKPRLLFCSNALMSLTAALMAMLTGAGTPSATLILVLTFVMGIGAAFTLPAWQASMSELVEREHMGAVAALNNLSYNVAALAGPCLGGFLLQQYGPGCLYACNALSFAGLLQMYWQWQAREPACKAARAATPTSLAAGLRASWQTVGYRKLLLHALSIFGAAIAFPALLPALPHLQSRNLGILMGALGAGAVLAPALLARWRMRLRQRSLLTGALIGYAAMLLLLCRQISFAVQIALVVGGGVAWSMMVTTLNQAAFSALPPAMRARTLSVYIFTVAAGQAAGAALWGKLATMTSVPSAMACAGIAMLVCTVSLFFSTDFLEPT